MNELNLNSVQCVNSKGNILNILFLKYFYTVKNTVILQLFSNLNRIKLFYFRKNIPFLSLYYWIVWKMLK